MVLVATALDAGEDRQVDEAPPLLYDLILKETHPPGTAEESGGGQGEKTHQNWFEKGGNKGPTTWDMRPKEENVRLLRFLYGEDIVVGWDVGFLIRRFAAVTLPRVSNVPQEQ